MITGKGPFSLQDETTLLQQHEISHLVCKNSGGISAYSKLEAARALGLPVIVKRRPPALRSPSVSNVGEAVAWLSAVCG